MSQPLSLLTKDFCLRTGTVISGSDLHVGELLTAIGNNLRRLFQILQFLK
jgi:hypothetical protein